MFGRLIGKISKHSSAILVGVGIASATGAAVMAHRAGRKVDETLDIDKKLIENTKELKDKDEIINENGERVPYSEKQYRKDIRKAYTTTAIDMIKLYGPPVGLLAASAFCVIKGHRKMAIKLAGVTAAYEALDTAFQKYRQNVITLDGEEKDRKYMYGLEKVAEGNVQSFNPETGEIEEAKVKKFDAIRDINLVASPYAVDIAKCPCLRADMNYNKMILEGIQHVANINLDQNGYLFLYDIYEALGVVNSLTREAIKASHCVGWIKNVGDGEVKFTFTLVPEKCGIMDGEIGTYKEVGLIDFNCCGVIIDKI